LQPSRLMDEIASLKRGNSTKFSEPIQPNSTKNATSVAASVTTGNLTAGSYSGVVTISAIGATPVTVPVTFTITAAPVLPAIGASPPSLSFTAQQGGGNPAAQAVSISKTGGGTLS